MNPRVTGSEAQRLLGKSGRSKYGVDRSESGKADRTYDGVVYASKGEASYAAMLDVRKKCGDIKEWWPQSRVSLAVNGVPICKLIIDFRVLNKDGSMEYVEYKGFETGISRLKRKLFAAIYPGEKLTVVKAK